MVCKKGNCSSALTVPSISRAFLLESEPPHCDRSPLWSKSSTLVTGRWNVRGRAVSFSDSKLCISAMTRDRVRTVAELRPGMTHDTKQISRILDDLSRIRRMSRLMISQEEGDEGDEC